MGFNSAFKGLKLLETPGTGVKQFKWPLPQCINFLTWSTEWPGYLNTLEWLGRFFLRGGSNVPLTVFSCYLDPRCWQLCYSRSNIVICSIAHKVWLVWIFVPDRKASHIPNIDNVTVPWTVRSLGSTLLHITVTSHFEGRQTSTCYAFGMAKLHI